jgi:hypothetical protein
MLRTLAVTAILCVVACASPRIHVREHSYRVLGKPWVEGKRDAFGKKVGVWTHYDAEGHKRSEGTFRSDVMHGAWTFWFDDGTELRLMYRNGVRITMIESISTN